MKPKLGPINAEAMVGDLKEACVNLMCGNESYQDLPLKVQDKIMAAVARSMRQLKKDVASIRHDGMLR